MSNLHLELTRGAAVVTLQRPERRNALSRALLQELGELGSQLLGDSRVRAIVLRGSGGAFCAGADLKERMNMTPDEVRDQLAAYQSCLGWIEPSPVPVVAAIHGAALGGGLELALLCDLRIAAPSAILALPETGLGVIPGAGGTQRLPRAVGVGMAKEMILLGRRLNAHEAYAHGLVQRLATSDELLLDETLAWIEPILNGAPIAQRAALAAIDAAALPLDAGLARERELYELCLASEDRKEALRAFAEKRAPVFQGS